MVIINFLFNLIIQIKGKLDCLRDSIGAKGETQEQRDKRIAANWDSDCSFESNIEGKFTGMI